MENIRQAYGCLMIFCIIALTSAACKKMDHTYKQFLNDGEKVYPEKVNSPMVYSGHNRVKISWPRSSDPTVVKAIIFWNNRMDSVTADIGKTGKDTISTVIDGLSERSYSFIIKTYDEDGNASVPTEVTAKVYGDAYIEYLLNRPINQVLLKSGTQINIVWGHADISQGAFETEVTYYDTLGETKTRFFPVSQDTSAIADIDPGEKFSYRTLYLPESSIDTFHTDFMDYQKDFVVKGQEIDSKNFEVIDYCTQHTGSDNRVTNLFDGLTDVHHRWHTWIGHCTYPHFVTVDMHSTVTITDFDLFAVSGGHSDRFPETFKLLVSKDNINWTDLGTYNFNRFTEKAQVFHIIGLPKARYFKFVGITGGGQDYMSLGEIEVYGLE